MTTEQKMQALYLKYAPASPVEDWNPTNVRLYSAALWQLYFNVKEKTNDRYPF